MPTKKSTTSKPPADKPAKAVSAKKPTAKVAAKKKAAPKEEAEIRKISEAPTEEESRRDYLRGIGRRKESVALVRLYKNGSGKIVVNNRDFAQYFPVFELQQIVKSATTTVGQVDKVDISVKVMGGGIRGQADAVRLGISRALIGLNPTFRRSLKKVGFLTRDARAVERKKFGLKKARRAPQWQKR